jgi:hypothetical protein
VKKEEIVYKAVWILGAIAVAVCIIRSLLYVVYPSYTSDAWLWPMLAGYAGACAVSYLCEIREMQEGRKAIAESSERLCSAAQLLRELAIKQKSIIQAQAKEIERLKGEHHDEGTDQK